MFMRLLTPEFKKEKCNRASFLMLLGVRSKLKKNESLSMGEDLDAVDGSAVLRVS
jgi:hypothetical protein